MDVTVGLLDILKTIKKRWKLIICITVIAALISGGVSYFILKPVYQASTQILVNQKNTENKLDYTLLQSNVDLINTYSVILKSPAILEKVINQLDLNVTWEELNKNLTVTSQENSQVFSLTVEDHDAQKAVEIANTVSDTFQSEIKGIMNVDNVSIIARAELKQKPVPVKPKPLLNIGIAILIGLILGMGSALLKDFMDGTLKDDQDAAACLGVPVLGTIQKISKAQIKEGKNSAVQTMGGETIVS
ncbi:Wzz/FepE/Etk N-terminal domain-containing protein [Neobacillus drentensis]|uniref:YveK family protein n=1 Tax=Neobacillus drentensis TaxID=220684 RepID=UPI002FFF35E8